MKNQFLVFCLAAGIFCLSGCRNDALEEAVSFSLGEPSRTEFTYQAGLGSVEVRTTGSPEVTAESSAPQWCRVVVFDNSTVAYNVDTNRSDQSRTATITVSVEGVPSESFEITQSRFTGLLVTPNELTFSEEVTEISVEVISACEYDIMWDRNDENVFSVEKSSDGRVLTFRSPLPGVYSRQGELRLVPEPAEGESLPGAEEVVKAVRQVYKKTLIVKLSPNVTDITEIARAAEGAGADSVSLINTLLGMAIDAEKRRPILSTITGGMSGAAVKPIALRMVWQVAKAVKIPVIGLGGIMNWKDAVEFMLAGASAIQIGTANFIDPTVTIKVAEGINDYLERHKFSSVRDIIGALEV